MTLLAIKLFMGGMLKRLWEALSGVFTWARHNPALAAIIALCVALAGVWWVLSGQVETAIDQRDFARNLAKEERANHVQTIANYSEAQTRARAFAVAQKQAEEARHKANAERIDRAFKNQLADARDATAEYIRTHRVRTQPGAGTAQGGGGSTLAAASDRDPGLPESLSAGIVMGEADVRACGALYPYAVKAHDFALGLAK